MELLNIVFNLTLYKRCLALLMIAAFSTVIAMVLTSFVTHVISGNSIGLETTASSVVAATVDISSDSLHTAGLHGGVPRPALLYQTKTCQASCQNGGECIERDTGEQICHCPEGTAGSKCERITPSVTCGNRTCYNNATCSPTGETCQCAGEYRGAVCVINRACASIQCRNYEMCIAIDSQYICQGIEGIYKQLFWKDSCTNNPAVCSQYNGAVCVDDYCGCPHGSIIVDNQCKLGKLRCRFHVDCQAVAIDMVCLSGECVCHQQSHRHPLTGLCHPEEIYVDGAQRLTYEDETAESRSACPPWCWIVAAIAGIVVILTVTLLIISTSQEYRRDQTELQKSMQRDSLVLKTSLYKGKQSSVEYYSVHQVTLTPKVPTSPSPDTGSLSKRKSLNRTVDKMETEEITADSCVK